MFSTRIPWSLAENELTRRAAARRLTGAPLLDLTESNPTRAGLIYPRDAILTALADPGALRYEPDPRGLPAAREAVARYYREAHATSVSPADVLLTASTSEAYALLFKLLCDPGDRVLVPRPSYPLFDLLAALESVALDPYPLGYDGAWYLDPAALAHAVTPRTRAVVVVNPNNPTGSFLKRDELAALGAFCAARGLALICDEVFADYAFGPDAARVTTAAGAHEHGALVFALSGLSKVCALPQLKLGWIAAAGPPALRAEAFARLELIADTYLSVGTPVQRAAPALLALRGELGGQVAARVARNRAVVESVLAGEREGGVHALHVEGGWYLTLRVPRVQSEDAWAIELLERDGVLVQPGYFFDFADEGYLVLSLLTPEATLREGVARLCSRAQIVAHGPAIPGGMR